MARAFDDQHPSQYTSSAMSSQTSLAANRAWMMSAEHHYPDSRIYDDDGTMWKYKRSAKKGMIGSKLTKIRSSPSHGALAAARASAGQEGRHKRGNSASASQSPMSSTFDVNPLTPDPYDLRTPPSAYSDERSIASPKSAGKSKVKIRPLLRKLSSNDENTIDLSRSAAENEGLGIYSPSALEERKSSTDISMARRGYHHRSNSQVSTTTTSSTHRYGAQYVHPMRQTPRPYTPPIATSFQHSHETDNLPFNAIHSNAHAHHSDSYQHQSPISAGSNSYAPLPSARRQIPPAHIHTHSSSRITSSSQTNLPGTPSSLRQQSDHRSTTDMFHSARSSFETFRQRSRGNTQTSPAEQAAAIAEARQQFRERQEAKDAKRQVDALRQEAKDNIKRAKREESERRRSEGRERRRNKSNAASEKTVNMGEQDNATTLSFIPGSPNEHGPRRRGGTAGSAGKAGKAVQSQWQLFWFKVKTAWLTVNLKVGMK